MSPPRRRDLAALALLLALGGCARVAPVAPAASAGPHAYWLQAPPAVDVQLETRGRLRPQYRAAGIAGEPMPYENAVDSSLILCAALGPLFGACAGVMLGGLAVAGVTETVVAGLAAPGSARDDAAEIRQVFAPNQDYVSALGVRVATAAVAALRGAGDAAEVAAATPAAACTLALAGQGPTAATAVDLVQLEVEFEPGFLYRLVVVARLRTQDCAGGAALPERRLAWRGQAQLLSRDAAAARARFDAEIARAVAALGADVAAVVGGRPRPVPPRY